MSRSASNKSSSQFGRGLSYNSTLPPFLQKLHAAAGDTSNRSSSGPRRSGIKGWDDLEEDERPVIADEGGGIGSSRGEGRAGRGGGGSSGREPLPERPREGKWAGGSDDDEAGPSGSRQRASNSNNRERNGQDDEEDDWDAKFGGGGGDTDGPQIVVLKEGKHLTREEVDIARAGGGGMKKKKIRTEDAAAGGGESEVENTGETNYRKGKRKDRDEGESCRTISIPSQSLLSPLLV